MGGAGAAPDRIGRYKVQLHGISKRGDTYLRTLLIHGARSVLQHAKDSGPWVEQLGQRRPPNVVAAALANKDSTNDLGGARPCMAGRTSEGTSVSDPHEVGGRWGD